MTDDATVMAVSGAAVAAVVLVAWLVSLRVRDASVADVAWGLGFVAVAWATFAIADGYDARKVVVVVLTTIWGLRLATYMARRRVRERGEDFRYTEMRERYGDRFPLMSLLLVFGLQGVGLWAVSLPVQLAQVPTTPAGLTVLDFAGIALWTVGFLFEAVGDLQLARFRADPANAGKVMDRGLWRFTRHPNYFGDFCVWWGLFAVALATDAWWAIAGPLTMSYVLLRMGGVPVMDAHMEGRAGYDEYARRTSGFFPLPPRSPS
jgi:steroid 5-alpha reductase family enzyme